VSHNELELPPHINIQPEESAPETDEVEFEATELSEDVENLESQFGT